MNWAKVADHLDSEAVSLQERRAGFPNDQKTSDELALRSRIAAMLARALRAGMDGAAP